MSEQKNKLFQMRKNLVANFEGGPRYKPVDNLPNWTRDDHSPECVPEAMAPTGSCNNTKQLKLGLAGSLMVVLAIAIVLVIVLTMDNRYSSTEDEETKKTEPLVWSKHSSLNCFKDRITNGNFFRKNLGIHKVEVCKSLCLKNPECNAIVITQSDPYFCLLRKLSNSIKDCKSSPHWTTHILSSRVATNPTKLAGTWSTVFTNGVKATFEIKPDGEISFYGGKTVLEASDDQVNFPSSQGWMKGDKLWRDASWSYYRVTRDGILEVEHFHSDKTSNTKNFHNLDNYCCRGIGHRQEPELKGYCMPSDGQFQDWNQSLNKTKDKTACYNQCKAVPQATGCMWHYGGYCVYHTRDVFTGNGNSDYKCWVFNSSPRGWTVIQRRGQYNNTEDYFFKTFNEYENGFGSVDKEFWIGLKRITEMTYLAKDGKWQLRVDLTDWDGKTYFALYDSFAVGPGPKYRLAVSKFDDAKSTLGDSLRIENDGPRNLMSFSAKDQDQDNYRLNCAKKYKGGWWYNACLTGVNLNGLNFSQQKEDFEGITWWYGKTRGDNKKTWRESTMKIRKIIV